MSQRSLRWPFTTQKQKWGIYTIYYTGTGMLFFVYICTLVMDERTFAKWLVMKGKTREESYRLSANSVLRQLSTTTLSWRERSFWSCPAYCLCPSWRCSNRPCPPLVEPVILALFPWPMDINIIIDRRVIYPRLDKLYLPACLGILIFALFFNSWWLSEP